MKTDLVFTQRDEVYTSSKIVAEKLEVHHRDLLRTIEKIIERQKSNAQHSALKYPQKFIESTFTNKQNRTYKCYLMNEQAFMKLAMHLSGYEKAEVVQDQMIEAFSMMKQALLNHQNQSWISKREQTKVIRKEETNTIKEFVEYAKERGSKNADRYYANITKMTYKALELLVQTEKGKPLRDTLSTIGLGFLMVLEERARQAIEDGMRRELPYREIYAYARDEVMKLAENIQFKRIEE